MNEQARPIQVEPFETWPGGEQITALVVNKSAKEIEDAHGIVFAKGLAELDYYKMAAIELSEGRQAWLWEYQRAPLLKSDQPTGQLEVLIDISDDVEKSSKEVMEILKLSEEDICWQYPYQKD